GSWWTLRRRTGSSERSLLSGDIAGDTTGSTGPGRRSGSGALAGSLAAGLAAIALILLTRAGVVDSTSAFFGAGASLLVGCVLVIVRRLARPPRRPLAGHGWWPAWRLGVRNAARRPL